MVDLKSLHPRLNKAFTQTTSGSIVCSYTSDVSGDAPILTLIHGYPQSAFIWRHVIPAFADKVSLFVPEVWSPRFLKLLYSTAALVLNLWRFYIGLIMWPPRVFLVLAYICSQGTSLQTWSGASVGVMESALLLNILSPLPGYGVSTACKKHSKKDVGSALLEALEAVFHVSETSRRKVILGGHDRGARICHRLAVDKDDFPNLDIIGTVLLDIVPTKVQWEAFANPEIAVGYFHWPFLANLAVAVPMLEAYGGGRWCRNAHMLIRGPNAEGQRRMASDNALDVYCELFDKKETIIGSCEDYASGAAPEVAEQAEDQRKGRKIAVPTLVMFSKAKLGARLDVEQIWKDWVQPGVHYQGIGVGDGHGHFLPEEACDQVSEAIGDFMKRL